MIDGKLPDDWRDLQNMVARILSECQVCVEVEKTIETARGQVNIDVWAHDEQGTPPQTYLVECKLWKNSIPQNVIHAFRTVVGDSGANWGAIVSASKFQSGAIEAAKHSNIRLLSYEEFQLLFLNRWHSKFFIPEFSAIVDPLLEYVEPINSRIDRKANLLHVAEQKEFQRLRDLHFDLYSFSSLIHVHHIDVLHWITGTKELKVPQLPFGENFKGGYRFKFPASILEARDLRTLLYALKTEVGSAIAQFDEVFGGRA